MAMAQGILPLEQAAMVLAMENPSFNTRNFLTSYHTINISPWEWAERLLFAEKSV
jgi:hypothetical protein